MRASFVKLAALCTLALLLLTPVTYSTSVTMNFAFNISGKTGNVIHVNGTDYNATQSTLATSAPEKKYVTAENGNRLFAAVFAGSRLNNITIDTSYTTQTYLLSVDQDDNDNRLLVAYTQGTWRDVDDKAESIDAAKFLAKTFRSIARDAAEFIYFIRLEYRNIDISSSVHFDGATKLFIRNRGSRNVTLEVMK